MDSPGIWGIILLEDDQGLMIRIDGEIVAVVKIMVELEGSSYYSKALFFGGDPIYFTIAEGSSGIRDWVLFTIITNLVDGSSYIIV